MVDLYNRVEARPGLGGSGMSAEPEKISEIQNQWEQIVRTYGQKRKTKFKSVLQDNKANKENKAKEEKELEEGRLDSDQKVDQKIKKQEKSRTKTKTDIHWVRV